VTNGRRHEGDPQRADFCDRFARIVSTYVSERIAKRCRCGAAAVGDHWSHRLLLSCGGTGEREAVAAPAQGLYGFDGVLRIELAA